MDAPLDGSATAMAAAVAAREVAALELVDATLARVERRNPAINAIVALRADEARAWTGGSRAFEADVATRDAPAVAGLRRAGAIPVGVTNTPELCMYYDSVNPLYGATRNPHDHSRSAGGSSGGEAAGLVPLGVGSDLSGSIRFPAHLTGVFGLRPTAGLVSVRGHHPGWTPLPFYELMAVMGPMARHAEDLGPALEALSGRPVGPAQPDLRVAVFEEDGLNPVSVSCLDAVRSAAAALAGEGLEVEQAVPPAQRETREVFDTIVVAEVARGLAPLLAERRVLLGERLGGMLDGAAGAAVPLEDHFGALAPRLELKDAVAEWQQRFPLALCPVGPVSAFSLGEPISDVGGNATYPGGVLTLCSYASALRLPACSVPAGRDAAGLPVGVQVIGRRGRDADVLDAAHRLEELLGGAIAPPAGTA